MNTYELLNLYPHNIRTCEKVRKAFNNGQDTVSIIKATGTGKSYIGLNLALEHKDEKIIWLVPTNAIKEHILQIINSNPNLSMERDFPNLEIRTYSSLVNLSDEEIEDIPCDLLIVDELHHIGAPVWGEKVNTLIYTHPNIKTFGMSAYSVRDRGTSYERDVTNPETEEIFSDTVVDRYDLYDAIIDGVLPLPIAKTILTEDSALIEELKDALKIKKITKKEILKEIEVALDALTKTIHKQNPVKEIIQETIIEDGKYIYFCPVLSYEGINDIETIKEQVVEYIKEKYPQKIIIVYQTTSDMGDGGKYNRDCFYHDLDLDGKDASNAIRIMFAKNQYNEGVHAPNVDGVFLGRKTTSDIVALEQIGRALAVRENIKGKRLEYSLLGLDKIKEIAKSKGLIFDEDITKEQLIELLLSPRIIDLTGNVEFLEELETNLKYRARERRKKGNISRERAGLLEKYSPFMLEAKKKELIVALLNLKKQVRSETWNDYYNLAVIYYNHYKHSEVPHKFKTKNGVDFDIDGVSLGVWCNEQRLFYNKKILSDEKIKKLELINFRFEDKRDIDWLKMYNLLKIYYNHYKHSEVPQKFKTKNGVDFDIDGVSLGMWCSGQRIYYQKNRLKKERINKLRMVNFRFENKSLTLTWDEYYKLVLAFFEHYGHCEIPRKYKTKDGITESNDPDAIHLGEWCDNQRMRKDKLKAERIKKLEAIDFRFNTKRDINWEKMYEFAKIYYKHYGNSEAPSKFKTKDGITFDNNGIALGHWYEKQRLAFNEKILSDERRKKLEQIEFRFKTRKEVKSEKIDLCSTYNIDFSKYKILDRMSYQELYAKIMFLVDNKLSLEIDGKLHPIFTMCNENIMINYGIRKEELITNYYINRKGRR